MRIGLLSDTHGYMDERIVEYLKDCDEIWHAGDIGTDSVLLPLQTVAPVRAVYGNIDGADIRRTYPEHQRFECEGMRIWMTHIGGYPPRYNPAVRKLLQTHTPDIFICGHSHILRVMPDANLPGLIYMNPGAAGKEGFHTMRTLLRFDILDRRIANLQAVELGKRGALSS